MSWKIGLEREWGEVYPVALAYGAVGEDPNLVTAGNGLPVAEGGRPARSAAAVTPHAVDPLPNGETRALYVGTGGNLVVRMAGGGADVTFADVAAGYHPLSVTHVRAASTAGSIVALY